MQRLSVLIIEKALLKIELTDNNIAIITKLTTFVNESDIIVTFLSSKAKRIHTYFDILTLEKRLLYVIINNAQVWTDFRLLRQ